MWPTSPEANGFKIGSTKLMYVINFGSHPYYKNLLIDDLAKTPYIVVMFDESLNEVLQKSQTNFIVRIWDNVAKRVQDRFFSSCLLTGTTLQYLLIKFLGWHQKPGHIQGDSKINRWTKCKLEVSRRVEENQGHWWTKQYY